MLWCHDAWETNFDIYRKMRLYGIYTEPSLEIMYAHNIRKNHGMLFPNGTYLNMLRESNYHTIRTILEQYRDFQYGYNKNHMYYAWPLDWSMRPDTSVEKGLLFDLYLLEIYNIPTVVAFNQSVHKFDKMMGGLKDYDTWYNLHLLRRDLDYALEPQDIPSRFYEVFGEATIYPNLDGDHFFYEDDLQYFTDQELDFHTALIVSFRYHNIYWRYEKFLCSLSNEDPRKLTHRWLYYEWAEKFVKDLNMSWESYSYCNDDMFLTD